MRESRPPRPAPGRRSRSAAATTTRGRIPRIFPRVDEWRGLLGRLGQRHRGRFWDGGRRRAEQREAAAERERGEGARSRSSIGRLAFEVRAAPARARLEPRGDSRPPTTASAPRSRRAGSLGERFNAGVATSTDVLDAQTDVLQAELRSDAGAGERPPCRGPARTRARRPLTASAAVGTESVTRQTPSKFGDLTRRFGAFVAVDDLSFDVRRGEIFGFLGSNGAGKSTTIRMLCGLLQPSSGSATVGGVDVTRDPEGVKQRIGYMSQRFSLYELLTVDQNIRFFGGIYGLDRAAAGRATRVRHRHGRSSRPRAHAGARSVGRMAAAAGARMRDPARAADPLSRRADRRRRSALPAPVLAPDRHALAARASPCW